MFKARPCLICRTWFHPDPMVGERQHVCGNPACQKERHRRACARFHEREPDYVHLQRSDHKTFPNRHRLKMMAMITGPLRFDQKVDPIDGNFRFSFDRQRSEACLSFKVDSQGMDHL